MAYIVTVHIGTAYIIMGYVVMAHIVMAAPTTSSESKSMCAVADAWSVAGTNSSGAPIASATASPTSAPAARSVAATADAAERSIY